MRISESTKFKFWQRNASFSLILMEGERKMRAYVPYLEPLQRKDEKCVIRFLVRSTGRSSFANALEEDDMEESWKGPLGNSRSFQVLTKRQTIVKTILRKSESKESLLRVSVKAFPSTFKLPSLHLTKPNKINRKYSCCLLSSLRMFTDCFLFPSSQNEEGCWYFGSKLANVMFWQNPPMAGNC